MASEVRIAVESSVADQVHVNFLIRFERENNHVAAGSIVVSRVALACRQSDKLFQFVPASIWCL